MRIIIPDAINDLVPAGARLQLRRIGLSSEWLVSQFITFRSQSTDSFPEYIKGQYLQRYNSPPDTTDESEKQKTDAAINDLTIAARKVENALDVMFPFQPEQPYQVYVKSMAPITENLAHGTVVNITPYV